MAFRPFRAPTVSLTEAEILSLRLTREKAAEKARIVTTEKVDKEAEDIVAKCCSFLRKDRGQKKRCQVLANLSNGQVQKVLNKIFLEGKCCKEHVEGMVTLLLNPKVTEFNFLCLWAEEERRGFDKYDQLCLKCPNLEKLKTLERPGHYSNKLYPQFKNMVSEHIILQKNLTLLALYGYNCSPQDLWLIQKNLPKLEHFEVVLQKVEMEIADPLGKMANLKRLDLNRSDIHGGYIEESEAHILVECAAKITKLETFIFKCSYRMTSQLFINMFFAKFPLKKLHLDNVKLDKEGLNFPWPKFLTCNSLKLHDYSDVQCLAGISFPLKSLSLHGCSNDCELVEIFGQNLQQLYFGQMGRGGCLILDQVMAKCPKLEKLAICDWELAYGTEEDSSDEEGPFKAENFSQIRSLSFSETGRDKESDDYTVCFYKDLLLKTKDLVELRVSYTLLTKAAMLAMDEDKNCFNKVQKLFVMTTYFDGLDDSAIAFKLAKRMIFRSAFLKEISIYSEAYTYKYMYHWKAVNKMAKSLKSSAEQLGINVVFEERDGF